MVNGMQYGEEGTAGGEGKKVYHGQKTNNGRKIGAKISEHFFLKNMGDPKKDSLKMGY